MDSLSGGGVTARISTVSRDANQDEGAMPSLLTGTSPPGKSSTWQRTGVGSASFRSSGSASLPQPGVPYFGTSSRSLSIKSQGSQGSRHVASGAGPGREGDDVAAGLLADVDKLLSGGPSMSMTTGGRAHSGSKHASFASPDSDISFKVDTAPAAPLTLADISSPTHSSSLLAGSPRAGGVAGASTLPWTMSRHASPLSRMSSLSSPRVPGGQYSPTGILRPASTFRSSLAASSIHGSGLSGRLSHVAAGDKGLTGSRAASVISTGTATAAARQWPALLQPAALRPPEVQRHLSDPGMTADGLGAAARDAAAAAQEQIQASIKAVITRLQDWDEREAHAREVFTSEFSSRVAAVLGRAHPVLAPEVRAAVDAVSCRSAQDQPGTASSPAQGQQQHSTTAPASTASHAQLPPVASLPLQPPGSGAAPTGSAGWQHQSPQQTVPHQWHGGFHLPAGGAQSLQGPYATPPPSYSAAASPSYPSLSQLGNQVHMTASVTHLDLQPITQQRTLYPGPADTYDSPTVHKPSVHFQVATPSPHHPQHITVLPAPSPQASHPSPSFSPLLAAAPGSAEKEQRHQLSGSVPPYQAPDHHLQPGLASQAAGASPQSSALGHPGQLSSLTASAWHKYASSQSFSPYSAATVGHRHLAGRQAQVPRQRSPRGVPSREAG